MSYAAEWNLNNKVKMPDGPTLTILSGEWDRDAEQIDLMDVDEDDRVLYTLEPAFVLDEVQRGRKRVGRGKFDVVSDIVQSWNQVVANEHMEWIPDLSLSKFVVVDTNVFISFLPLVQSFVSYLVAHPAFPIKILVPGVVVHELDGLSKSGRRDVENAARSATKWLLDQVRTYRNGTGPVLPQRDTESMLQPNWRANQYNLLNDDLILDCCTFYADRYSTAALVMLSSDKNLCVKCESHGIVTITPQLRSTRRQLLDDLGLPVDSHQDTTSNQLPITPQSPLPPPLPTLRKPTPRITPKPLPYSGGWKESGPNEPTSMELDSDYTSYTSARPPIPLSLHLILSEEEQLVRVHDALMMELTNCLPVLVKESVEEENGRRVSGMRCGPREFSKHDKRVGVQDVEFPMDDSWKTWPIRKSLFFLVQYPLRSMGTPLAFVPHPFVVLAKCLASGSRTEWLRREESVENLAQALQMLRYTNEEIGILRLGIAAAIRKDDDV